MLYRAEILLLLVEGCPQEVFAKQIYNEGAAVVQQLHYIFTAPSLPPTKK